MPHLRSDLVHRWQAAETGHGRVVRQLEVEVAAYALRAPVDASSQTDISGSVEAVGDSMSPLVRGQKEALDRAVAAAADSEALRFEKARVLSGANMGTRPRRTVV